MRFSVILLLFGLLPYNLNAIDCSLPDCTKTQLKNGIIWYHKTYSNLLGGPQNVNIVDIDFMDPHIYIKPVYKQSSSCERTSSMGMRTSAIAGINGGFFDGSNGCIPTGLLKIDNKVISYAVSYRPARSALGIKEDETIIFRKTDSSDSFPEAIHALGGMPNLVKDGNLYVTTSSEQADSIAGVNPRTAICRTSNNHFLMITVDGRASGRTGMTLDDLAQYLLWLGCSDGINLDGGGSTTMWVNTDGVVNYPSDGSERYVSNGLFVYYIENLPPVIEHEPVSSSDRKDIIISARVTDDYGLKAINLKFKNKTEKDFISRQMISKGDDLYEATISKDEIVDNIIQYYIAAWDGTLRTTLPVDAESNGNYYQILILDSTDAGVDVEDAIFDISFDDSSDSDAYLMDIKAEDSMIDGDLIDVYGSYDISDISEILDDSENNDIVLTDNINFDSLDDNIVLDVNSDIIIEDSNYPVDSFSYDSKINNDSANDVLVENASGCSCDYIE